MPCSLTLLVPQLLWPEPQDAQAWESLPAPALERLLARGQLLRQESRAWEDALLDCLSEPERSPARLRRSGEADSPSELDGCWLCADPVHLKFHHERVVLADSSAFPLASEESAALIDALNREFGDLGRFEAPHPQRWYLQLNTALDYTAPPLSAVTGRTLEFPENGDASRVKRWLNEIQMFLHAHPVNQARETRGQPPVNSLWLWGGETGVRPRFSPEENRGLTPVFCGLSPVFSGIWSNQPLAIGLARAANIPQHPDAIDLGNVLAKAAPGSHHLVVLDSLLMPALYEDSTGWREALLALEARWFAPLAAGKARATLIAPTRYGLLRCDWEPLARCKFWRRPQPLAALARSLAQ